MKLLMESGGGGVDVVSGVSEKAKEGGGGRYLFWGEGGKVAARSQVWKERRGHL